MNEQQAVHGSALEMQKGKHGEMVRAAQVTHLPVEVSMLVVIDQLSDENFKKQMVSLVCAANNKAIEVLDRNEARKDKQNEAAIKDQHTALWIAAFLFILVLAAFTWCCLCGIPAASLWAFCIFFLGSAGFFALRRFRRKE